MKRILSVICAVELFGGFTLQAAPVNPGRALDIARKIFAAQPVTKASTGEVKILWDGEDIATKAAQPAFYVITREGGGFVIIAGDDNVQPVLALSEREEFSIEDMPDNVKWWMDRMKAYVRSVREQSQTVRDQWSKYTGTKAGAGITGTVENPVEHLTPAWSQGDKQGVFQAKCPVYDDEGHHCIVGCVALSLGEILTTMSGIYPEMPAAATGSVDPYTVGTNYFSAAPTDPYVLGTTYQWADLRELTTVAKAQAASDEVRENLAQLLADLGAIMTSSYSAKNTSAHTNYAPARMAKYFGFNKTAEYISAEDYSDHQWEEILKSELYKHPVMYTGRTEPNDQYPKGRYGHAFVFDGYGTFEGSNVFHVNFGWSGYCNGYYCETNLDSDGDPEYNYSWRCAAIVDFYPNPSSTYANLIRMDGTGMQYVYEGNAVSTFAEGGGSFSVNGWIWNTGKADFEGDILIALVDKNDNIKEELILKDNVQWGLNGGWNEFSTNELTFTKKLELGDAVAFFYTTDETKTSWAPVQGVGPASNVVTKLPVLPMIFIKTKDSYAQDDWFELALMNHAIPYAGTIWTITDPDGTTFTKSQKDIEFQLTKKGFYKLVAAVAPAAGEPVVETVVAYIEVK